MILRCFWIIQSYFKICFPLLSLGLPGGDLVDGLPPAASKVIRLLVELVGLAGDYETIRKFRFFSKVEFFI